TKGGEWSKVREEVRKLFPQNARVYVTTLNDWVETYRKLLANYRTPVYIFILLIGAFGTINLLNTLITNMLVRRRELGIMQAVGLSGRQLSRLLMAEGLLYTLGVYVLSVALGAPLGRLLCQVFSAMSVFGAVEYRFPLLEMTAFLLIMLVIQVIFSRITIRLFRRKSLVDQIRELA
ncbi:MAG: FtsX-like permease family protein, partial [Acetatifactor sp.]|nr:FtsX-like permease family protein [Acetatifactor sp.]